ncbi:MAG: MFS transporter, partial [Anaerolineales bacterium]
MSSTSLPWPRLVGLVAFALALGIVSNTLEPALLGHKALELVPENKNTALGLTTFGGLLVALLWQPIVGGWSDRLSSRWGRRIPFFLVGTVIAGVSLVAIAGAPVFGLVVVGVLFTQLGTNTIQGPWQALIPDGVPLLQRGRAAGYKALLEILGFIVGRWASGRLVGQGQPLAAVGVAIAGLLAALALSLAVLERRPARPDAAGPASSAPARPGIAALFRGTFQVDWKANPGFGWWMLNRFLFWGGFIALNTFLLFYLIDAQGMAEPDAQRFAGDVATVLGAAILVVTFPAGWVSDRIGRRAMVSGTGILAAAGTGLLITARGAPAVVAAGAVLGLGVGAFLSADWALLTDIVPRASAARYLGIANVAAAGGSAMARLLGGVLIDPLAKLGGHPLAGYGAVFGAAMIGFLVAAWAILR